MCPVENVPVVACTTAELTEHLVWEYGIKRNTEIREQPLHTHCYLCTSCTLPGYPQGLQYIYCGIYSAQRFSFCYPNEWNWQLSS